MMESRREPKTEHLTWSFVRIVCVWAEIAGGLLVIVVSWWSGCPGRTSRRCDSGGPSGRGRRGRCGGGALSLFTVGSLFCRRYVC